MAHYQVLYWRHIPLGVKASDLDGTVRENLPPRFQEAIDRLASKEGETSTSAYTSMFRWSPPQEREGSAAEVAKSVVTELDGKWPDEIPLEPPED
jgi:hypothetical protein